MSWATDGFNECPPKSQQNLIKDLHAFSLRSPAPIVVTAHEALFLSEPLMGRTLRFAPLNQEHKLAVLRAYAEERLPIDAEALIEPFQTPYEISLAANCLEDPACLVSRAALLDAYIRRRCETTPNAVVVRRVLCAIAARMHRRLASSLPISEVQQLAAKALRDENARTQLLTDALNCGLLDVRQGRASFRHELLERSLQAEALIREHGPGPDVALALMMPRNRSLAEFVVAMEADPEAIRRCLEAVADPAILTECLRGRYGNAARDVAIEDCTRVVEAAERALEHTAVQLTGSESWKSLVVTEGQVWSPYDRALMQAVGQMLPDGLFLDEAFRLIARTEERCRAVLTGTDDGGTLGPADAMSLFAGLYVFTQRDASSSCLPASTIYQASRVFRPGNADGAAAVTKVLSLVAESLEKRSPGELLLLCEMLRFATPELRTIVPQLLRACWRTGIYHLRLDALQMAQRNATSLTSEVRAEVESFLSALHSNNLGLSTAIVDALLAFGMVNSPVTTEDVARDLAVILESDRDPAMNEQAYSAVSNMFEEVYQDTFWDAISALHRDDRIRLLIMAALGAPRDGFFADWILQELLDLADARALPAFLRWATTMDIETPFQQQATTCYVLGVRGCAQYLDEPPAPEQPKTDADRAWHAYGAIIFWLYKAGLSEPDRRAAAAQWWERLQSNLPLEAVVVLLQLEQASHRVGQERRVTLDDLCSVFPDEVRSVLEFGLVNRTSLTGVVGWTLFRETAVATLIRWLGVVGNRLTMQLLDHLLDTPDLGPCSGPHRR